MVKYSEKWMRLMMRTISLAVFLSTTKHSLRRNHLSSKKSATCSKSSSCSFLSAQWLRVLSIAVASMQLRSSKSRKALKRKWKSQDHIVLSLTKKLLQRRMDSPVRAGPCKIYLVSRKQSHPRRRLLDRRLKAFSPKARNEWMNHLCCDSVFFAFIPTWI